MKSLLTGVIIGLAAGVVASWLFVSHKSPPQLSAPVTVVRDIRNVPRMSAAEAETHRASRFESLTTVAETLALPSDFDQTEALYVLAGRHDSAGVQDLIHQASRIADPSDRNAGLSILFARLTDIDPESAIALAAMPPYASERSIEPSIWRTWARYDLDAALQAAVKLTPAARKIDAAQAFYAAYGYDDNDDTRYIETVLGVPPGQWVKSRYLESLASESPQQAIDYINGLTSQADQMSAAWALGDYIGRTSASLGANVANLIDNLAARQRFEVSLASSIANTDPIAFLTQYLDNPDERTASRYVATAFSRLVLTDVDIALSFYESMQQREIRASVANTIAKALAATDPERALDWARSNRGNDERGIYQQTVAEVAVVAPELAFAELNSMPAGEERDAIATTIIAGLAMADPALAVAALDQLSAGQAQRQAAQYLLMTWISTDPDAAIAWGIENDSRYGSGLLMSAGRNLTQMDPHKAMNYLPQLDQQTASQWSQQIASQLASRGSVDEALAFVERRRNAPGFEQLQAVMIGPLANHDPEAAHRVLASMSSGETRDNAIYGLMQRSMEFSDSDAALINTIGNPDLRKQTQLLLVYKMARSDYQRAITALDGLDLDDEERQQVLETLNQRVQHFD